MMLWKIYYDDQSIVTSDDMAWKDAPYRDILSVEIFASGVKIPGSGMEYYLMRGNSVIGFNQNSLHDHLFLGVDSGIVKFGSACPWL